VRRLKALIVKEFIQIRRDPLTLAMLMLIPIVQLVLFGFADQHGRQASSDDRVRPLDGAESREFVESLAATQYFDIRASASSFDDIRRAIERGECVVGIASVPISRNASRGATARRSRSSSTRPTRCPRVRRSRRRR
jgi:ABC-2 type transport system permease protein